MIIHVAALPVKQKWEAFVKHSKVVRLTNTTTEIKYVFPAAKTV
jgi:hypothetical protein